MKQYHAIKARHKDTILFFRMGDFYEMFNEDAKIGAGVLGITLTSRGHGKTGDVPLAGFPHHALQGYLNKMIRAGYRVAVCEQLEDPKLAKGIVKRGVIQVVTPGTVTEDNLLETGRNNYLCALYKKDQIAGIASADVSTGSFNVTETELKRVLEVLAAIEPAEILIPDNQVAYWESAFKNNHSAILTRQDDWIFGFDYAHEVLTDHFKTASLKGFGCDDLTAGLSAAGAVMHYIRETQRTDLSYIRRLERFRCEDTMYLDTATRNNLEITHAMPGSGHQRTLVSILDKTLTAMGARTLVFWLQRPLNRLKPIQTRLSGVSELACNPDLRDRLQILLKNIRDIERLITKVVTGRVNPRDLSVLAKTLSFIPDIKTCLQSAESEILSGARDNLSPCTKAVERILAAIIDDPPAQIGAGGFIRGGFSSELDELRKISVNGKDWIASLQKTEREKQGIPSLKIGYNKVFGYYIEVTKTHLSKIPDDYIRKQTLVNAERFITPELKEMEEKMLRAEQELDIIERRLFDELRVFTADYAEAIQKNGHYLGVIDALLSFAVSAVQNKYIKPEINEENEIVIHDGRHPVVEHFLPSGETFVPNDVLLGSSENQVLIITGPNMAGKSTYLRQAGLLVLMAQTGSFIPASSAKIGIVDRIFTRVGAQDNLAGGESTFLVEMNETANILNNATSKSLLLLDEIGRGTSTFDGLSIAWAVAEYLHEEPRVQAKTLFATHYHELTELAIVFSRVKNYNIAVKEWGDDIVFLRKIVPGGCDHSYGIQVARLAGIPQKVIARAKEVLKNLEANELTPNAMPKLAASSSRPLMAAEPQLSFFTAPEHPVLERLSEIDVNTVTPVEAIRILDELKKMT